ncbi:MAG TPA: electron transfer flavoprotein subunit alpha/FixB family protein [Gemmatimonadales bacterium]|nr:electron transfer flavoprotein subunit alpha/FixB family protein [Gemmatimonadales bacterium]
MANILAFAESRGGKLRKSALEAVTAARSIADARGGEVHAVLLGASGISGQAEALGRHGADTVIVVEHDGFANYNPEASSAFIADRLASGYDAAVFPATAQGRDLAPRVAARRGVGMASDVTDITVESDALVCTHPVNIGKVIARVRVSGTPAIVSVRPSAFTPVESPREVRVEPASPSGDPSASRVKVVELREGSAGKLDLGEAPIIVSGGRGLKSADNFKLVEDLADAFGNAAVGATRAVTDDGWRPHTEQIGQTGRTVSPRLYVAIGISGAIQHLAGMRTSGTIVAINKDKDAPIFRVADYGIIGDAIEIVPVLTEAVRKAKQS